MRTSLSAMSYAVLYCYKKVCVKSSQNYKETFLLEMGYEERKIERKIALIKCKILCKPRRKRD